MEAEHHFILPWELEKSKLIAFLDYHWLGEKLVGAPDNKDDSLCLALWGEEDRREYPVKISYIPHWFKVPKTVGGKEYFTWTYLDACKSPTHKQRRSNLEELGWSATSLARATPDLETV